MTQQNFIATTHLDTSICDEMVNFFWSNHNQHTKGVSGSGAEQFDTSVKDSTDLVIRMGNVLHIPFFKKYDDHLTESVHKYIDVYSAINDNWIMGMTEPFIIQHYKKGGGFKKEHCERTGSFDKSIKRVLVFTTYLNDVPNGGTHFKYFNHTEKAEKGKTVIFPSDWTHTHVGQITNEHEKTITTGWISHRWD
mgnify:CR=1 FL=1